MQNTYIRGIPEPLSLYRQRLSKTYVLHGKKVTEFRREAEAGGKYMMVIKED